MPTIDLNIMQERELGRLLDYERATCTVDGDLVYHCAFPYRPDDDLQRELVERGALMQKIDDRRGTVVAGVAEIGGRLDRIDRSIQRLERDIGIANEAFAIFMRSWLTATPQLPEAAQAAAQAQGGQRYDRFLEALGRRLAGGPTLRQEVPEEREQG